LTSPSGRILAFNGDCVFGCGRLPNMYVWSRTLEYQLYSARRDESPEDKRVRRNREALKMNSEVSFR